MRRPLLLPENDPIKKNPEPLASSAVEPIGSTFANIAELNLLVHQLYHKMRIPFGNKLRVATLEGMRERGISVPEGIVNLLIFYVSNGKPGNSRIVQMELQALEENDL